MVWELSSLIFRDNVESGFDLSKILSIGKNWLYSQGACRMRLLPNSQRPQARSAASKVLSSSINRKQTRAHVHYRVQAQQDFLFGLHQVKNNYTKFNWTQILKIVTLVFNTIKPFNETSHHYTMSL